MGTTLPIKSRETLERMKRYYKTEKANPRNYTLIVLATNTALRIGDLLELKWKDLYSEEYRQFYTHLSIKENKTEKHKIVLLNNAVTDSLKYLYDTVHPKLDCYVFQSRTSAIHCFRYSCKIFIYDNRFQRFTTLKQ